MKFLILTLFLLGWQMSSFAAEKTNCDQSAFSLLMERSEVYVYTRHPALKVFLDCESENFGVITIVHEAVHFEDLGVPPHLSMNEVERWFKKNLGNLKLNLLLLDGTQIGEMQIKNAPSPKLVILNFLKKFYPAVYNDSAHTLQSLIELYLEDETMLSASSYTKGLMTEFNAYNHSLRIENRFYGNQPNFVRSRYGVLGFIFFIKAYLYNLEHEYPKIWKEVIKVENKRFLYSIFENAASVLELSKHCKTMDSFERRDLFNLVEDQNFLGSLRNALGIHQEVLLDRILCLY